jgi:dCMP deaminase
MLINAGIEEIYFRDGYDDPLALDMFDRAGVTLTKI